MTEKPRKPTRRDLLVVIGRLQNMIGSALSMVDNDRSEERIGGIRGPLERAHALCVDARGYDPPLEQKGPWS